MMQLRHTGAVLLGLTLLTLVSGADPGFVEIVSPPGNAVLPAAPFYVISKGEPVDLVVDGRPQAWEPFAGPARAVRLCLKPGHHEIRVGKYKLAVLVKDRQAAERGEFVRLHPIQAGADGCSACHQTSQRHELTVVGSVKPFAACLECHPPAQFEAKHAHPLEPLKHCASCHAPHGSLHQGLLKAPAKKLCAACHDS